MTNINTFQGDVFIPEYIKHTGDDNNLFGFSGTDTFKIATAGSDRLTVGSDGAVTVANDLFVPEYIKHSGDTDTYIRFTDNNIGLYAGGNHKIGINATNTQFYSDIYMSQYMYHYSDNNTYFGFPGNDTFVVATSGSERISVDSSGRVVMGNRISGGNFTDVLTIADTRNADNWSVNNTMFKIGHKPSNQNNHYGLSFAVTANRGDGIIQTYNQNAGAQYDLLLNPGSGSVGVGTTNPTAKFHVTGGQRIYGYESQYDAGGSDAYFIAAGVGSNPPYTQYSLYCQYWVRAPGYNAMSDSRIKNNIVDVTDSSALETLRALQPKYYNYVDTRGRGTNRVIGFIAQEVKEACPEAVSTCRDYIPNIYELANVSDSNVITFTNFNTSNFESNASVINTISVDGEHKVNIAEIIDGHTIRVEEDLSEWTRSIDENGNIVAGNQLFVYGQEVDDFHNLNKDTLFSVATASIQEIDRQQLSDKARIDTLESQYSNLLTRVTVLESA